MTSPDADLTPSEPQVKRVIGCVDEQAGIYEIENTDGTRTKIEWDAERRVFWEVPDAS